MRALLNRYQNREDGFTLIELLIVVLIIGILAAIAIPIYLGIQANGYKSAVRADVNISVKRVQVALTENAASMAEIKTNQGPYKQQSVKGELVQILDSTTSGASTSDYLVKGVVSTSSSPAGPINYSYIYDSVSGKFTESDAAVLGSSIPSTTITTSALPDATKDAAYSATVTATTTNPGGTTVYSATGLPSTLTMDSATGKITGTPTTANTYNVTVTASNAGVSDSKTYTLNVYAKPAIVTTTLPAASSGVTYSQAITATGNPAPTFTATGLPTGLTISTSGVIGGSTTVTGSNNVNVTATNAGGSDVKAYTLVVNAAPSISTTSLTTGTMNSAYSQTISATGYPAPTFTATGLPSTLNIDSSSGTISGTPTTGGTYNVTVKAANGISPDATQAYTLTINGQLATPAVSLSRFIGRNSMVSWNAVANATSYKITYSGAYNATVTTTGTNYTQALPISSGVTNVNATVTALNSAYADSNTGSTAISVPGYRLTSGPSFATCANDSNGLAKNVGTCALVSSDGAWTTVSQPDGNFVEYKTDVNNINTYRAYYATQLSGSTNYYAMQSDNNLVAYNANGAIKATNTYSSGSNGYLTQQTDGNLALYTTNSTYVWGTLNNNTSSNSSYSTTFMYYVGP